MVESSSAPNRRERPSWRAIEPSTRSVKALNVMITVAMIHWPRLAQPNAPTITPTVPATVTRSGEIRARSSSRATGSKARLSPAFTGPLKILAMALPPYRRRPA
jgi:hypothetical protein